MKSRCPSVQSLILVVLLIGFLAYGYALLAGGIKEPFGATSPGTMVQLATSHVPTMEDLSFYRNVYPKMVRRDLIGLTGSDPGPLQSLLFPRYDAGTSLVALA